MVAHLQGYKNGVSFSCSSLLKTSQALHHECFVVILLTLGAASAMHLGYQKGQRYTHNYRTDVTHAIPGGSAKTLGLRVRCQAHADFHKKTEMQITLENIQVHQVQGNLQDPKQQQEKAADPKVVGAMQRHLARPVRVVLKAQDGSIKEIHAHPQDEEWSLNIKRGLANLFQISPRVDEQQQKNDKQFVTQQETTAVGDCQVSYVMAWGRNQPDQKRQVARVTKVINYDKCQNRPEFNQNTFYGQKCENCQQSLGYAPYFRSSGQIEHTLAGSAQAGYIIRRTEAVEQHVITPFSRSGGQLAASARQTLEFVKQAKAGQAAGTLTRKTSHRFVAENPEKRARQNAQMQQQMAKQAEATLNDMCKAVKEWNGQQAAEKFTQLVQQLRQCNRDTFAKLADNVLARQNPTERRFCVDALSFVGTREAVQVLQKKIQDKKINKPDELKRVFLGLASAPRPTADHINIAWELCNHAEVRKDMSCRRQCMLTFGALVHKIRQRPSLQQDTKAVAACQQHVREILNRLADQKTTQEEKQMYIKALGNAGSHEAREQLQKTLRDQTQALRIRVECVWALRRIIHVAREKVTPCLVSIFADANENPELRMAIFNQLLNSRPNFATLQAAANIVKREITNPAQGARSNQVASFVISHLSALAYHNNVLTRKREVPSWIRVGSKQNGRPRQHAPRNMNAKLQLNMMGYKMNALEFGARIENMDDVVEQVISEVRRRHKRSLWGGILSWLSEDEVSQDDEDDMPSPSRPMGVDSARHRTSSTRTTRRPTGTQKPFTPQSTDGQDKAKHVSAFVKLFGDEVKFMEIKSENIKQFAQDLADLLLGKKERIEYADQGIVITRKGMEIQQTLEKAFLVANARRMVPTLAGIPLDIQYRSAAAARVIAAAKFGVDPSITSLLQYKKLTANVQIIPSISAHEHTQIGIHTPFLRMGVRAKGNAHANAGHKIDATFEAAKEYKITYHLPKEQREILHIKYNAQGFVQQQFPQTGQTEEQQIAMDFKTPHLRKLQRTCHGRQNLFGVQVCVEGQVPDLPALRLQQVAVFPTIALTELRVSMVPAQDKPAAIQCTHRVTKRDDKQIQAQGEIDASSKAVRRRIPYEITYTRAKQEMVIEAHNMQAQGCENCRLKCTANREGIKLQFGRGQLQYQVSANGQVQDQGKSLRLQLEWTEVPEQWRQFFYNWEPQIWYFLQQFAWVRRAEKRQKRVAVEFTLTSPLTAQLRVKTPDATAERTDLALPMRVDRLPASLQEIKNNLYAQCQVQDASIKVFDNLQYKHNIKGGCPYVLVQDHRKGKQTRIQLTVKIDKQGQKTVAATIRQPSLQSVVIKPDKTIMINGKQTDCSQKACELKQGEATVRKVQKADGKTQIQLSTKLGLHATVEDQRIQVYASPLLRSRMRGLCGDADGEQWNEYRDPQDRVQELNQFIQSWQQKSQLEFERQRRQNCFNSTVFYRADSLAIAIATCLLKRGAKIDVTDSNGLSALSTAVIRHKEDMVALFLEETGNFDLNSKDKKGNTALFHAANVGNFNILNALVVALKKYQLSVNVANNDGATPLIQACINGDVACAKYLIMEGKACMSIRERVYRKTALEWAKMKGIHEFISNDNSSHIGVSGNKICAKLEENPHFQRKQRQCLENCKKPENYLADSEYRKKEKTCKEQLRQVYQIYEWQLTASFKLGRKPPTPIILESTMEEECFNARTKRNSDSPKGRSLAKSGNALKLLKRNSALANNISRVFSTAAELPAFAIVRRSHET
ncbi:hypothetical protein OS493_025729 [Desmophyllum pertusum]|uniref:Vitellogenin n=1 Tax=Desmophyllum pertusum TaxID=174260 RepID=A0A9W9ZLD6_9CNID|nr:hypothetical protein OS493_025729 [Desmophyllum pertusum]